MNKLLADVFRCAMVQKPVAFSVHIIVLEGEGTERVTTNEGMRRGREMDFQLSNIERVMR